MLIRLAGSVEAKLRLVFGAEVRKRRTRKSSPDQGGYPHRVDLDGHEFSRLDDEPVLV